MSRMIDTWHDLYHTGTTVDLINCPHCQDEFMAWEFDQDPETNPVDRLEELEVSR